MSTPKRIQRKRVKGWSTPVDAEGRKAVYVGRGSKWGNPFRVYRCDCCGMWDVIDDNGVSHHIDHAAARGEIQPAGIVLEHGPALSGEEQRREAVTHAVELFVEDITEWRTGRVTVDEIRAELAGRDLMCWCAEDAPCHGDVLLELANGGDGRD